MSIQFKRVCRNSRQRWRDKEAKTRGIRVSSAGRPGAKDRLKNIHKPGRLFIGLNRGKCDRGICWCVWKRPDRVERFRSTSFPRPRTAERMQGSSWSGDGVSHWRHPRKQGTGHLTADWGLLLHAVGKVWREAAKCECVVKWLRVWHVHSSMAIRLYRDGSRVPL